jgi:hypothetical protein
MEKEKESRRKKKDTFERLTRTNWLNPKEL